MLGGQPRTEPGRVAATRLDQSGSLSAVPIPVRERISARSRMSQPMAERRGERRCLLFSGRKRCACWRSEQPLRSSASSSAVNSAQPAKRPVIASLALAPVRTRRVSARAGRMDTCGRRHVPRPYIQRSILTVAVNREAAERDRVRTKLGCPAAGGR